MRQIYYLLLVLLIGCLCGPTCIADINLVKDHKAESAIIIPDEAIAPETFAAEELQHHIKTATGAELPVYKEKDTPQNVNSLIYIGKCKATEQAGIDVSGFSPSAYVVKTLGNKLFLAGKDRVRSKVGNTWAADWQGTLFAVYDLLENDMGVLWLWPGELGEFIPRSSNLNIKSIDRKDKPKYLSAYFSLPKSPKDLLGWGKKVNKERFLKEQRLFLLRHRFCATECMYYGHHFSKYWKRFGKSHPEYFSLLPNGKRAPLEGNPGGNYITMCVSQPELWKQIISDWKKSPERKPEHIPYRPYVNACENDTPGMCTCAACRAWDAPDPGFKNSKYWTKQVTLNNKNRFSIAQASWGEDGECVQEPPSLSDRYAKFYMALLKEAKKVDPEAKVVGYAYANYWKAPKETTLNKDIIISYVPPLWFPYTEKTSEEFRKNWDGWFNSGVQLRLRPNLTHAGANLPIFYGRRVAKDIAYAANHGMTSAHYDALIGAWSSQGPTIYALIRAHEHPEWSADKILDEYYSGFGKAAGAMKKYFEYWEKYSDSLDEKNVKKYSSEERDKAGRKGGGFKNYVLIGASLFPPKVFVKAHELLNDAKQAAKGDKSAEQRVAYIEKGLIDAELTVAVRIAQKKAEKNPSKENKKAFLKAFEKLKKYRASVEKDNVCNFGYMAYREKGGAGWPWENHE